METGTRSFGSWRTFPEPSRQSRGWREEGSPGVRAFIGIVIQLLLVVAVVHWLDLESGRGLTQPVDSSWLWFSPIQGGLVSLLAAGFLVHAFLPVRWRMPFFLGLSFLGCLLVLGWLDGGFLILFGVILIGLCHLPLPFGWRVGLVIAFAILLGILRAGVIATPIASTVIPVLASLFMFRLIVYLYDLRNEAPGVTPWQRFSYFFLAPNVCFPLFPVVDYTTFLRTWYDEPELKIYQKGVRWMSRGIVHLVLYRVIYQNFSPAPADVQGLSDVVIFVVTSYLLYLRISGQFHLIIGLLCLFGFNLPETHHRYLLASGFSDYWRRINIYWKDFMMKIVFYPSYVRFKRWGTTKAIVAGTALVFLATWFLHGYQWFWLRGMIHFSVVDALFWAFFALLVIINSLIELRKKPRPRAKGKEAEGFDWKHATRISLQTGAMFTLICLLFCFWQSQSVSQFFGVLSQAFPAPAAEILLIVGLILGALGLGVLVPWVKFRLGKKASDWSSGAWVPVAGTVVPLLLIVGLANDTVLGKVGPRAESLLAAMRATGLNARDQESLDRGYYEGLLQRENFGGQLWEVRLEQKPGWQPTSSSGVSRLTGDLLYQELVPNQELELDGGVTWQTNEWGMHDWPHYTKEKPKGVYRIALLSASYAAGYGMEIEETFENRLEVALNERKHPDVERIEILNFSVPGYTLVEFVAFLETRIAPFEPDAFFLVTHSKEGSRTLATVGRRFREGVPLIYPFLEEIPERLGLTPESTDQEFRFITRFRDEAETWGYGRMVDFCRRHDMTPVWIHLPATDEEVVAEMLAAQSQRAEEAGFHPLFLDGAYGEGDRSEIWLAPNDRHPNAEGHRRISVKLLEELMENAEAISLPVEAGASSGSSGGG